MDADTPMSDGHETELCSERWSLDVLARISRQRNNGRHLCDVIVACDDHDDVFPVHRCVLAASSEYFDALFSSTLGDCEVRDGVCHAVINTSLLGVSSDSVDKVLEFMYAGRIALTVVNLPEVLRLADFLRMRELVSLCADYMAGSAVCLDDDPALCLAFLHLVDAYDLSAVSPSLAEKVDAAASSQLAAVFAVVADSVDPPTPVVARLLADPEIGSVPEPEILSAICRLVAKRPHDEAALDLLQHVSFEYLGASFASQEVLANPDVVEWLDRRRPEVLATLRDRVERQGAEGCVDVVVCGRRFPLNLGDPAGSLLVYVIQDDEWVRLRGPENGGAESGWTTAGRDWLGGLECVVIDGRWLYALGSVHAGSVSYVRSPVVVKRFCRLDLSGSGGGGPRWQRLASPEAVQTHCRLVVSVDGIYAVDQRGVVERYSVAEDRWSAVCTDGFPTHGDTTLYVLPMLVGGDSRLCALRVYSGPSRYPTRCVTIYALDVPGRAWTALRRSDIELAELLVGDEVNFHGYAATPGSLRLLDELGRERASYDLVSSDWTFTSGPQTPPPRPKFVGDVLGSVAHAGRVYCACVGRADYVMYDVTRTCYKVVRAAPDSPSGVMCHARLARASLALMTSTAQS